ncbi:hypothetical protein LJB99_00665 [Deltaproteobacteria bacterium OttesenSCG-928-K17]|nr:hypothetical protein [Deltaproteobacteria bacterium OttesenSCG-928-K17]
MTRNISSSFNDPKPETDHISILASLDGLYLDNRPETESTGQWTILNCGQDGLNIYYDICLMRPEKGSYQVSLPWQDRQCCPACQGRGLCFSWKTDNLSYEESACPECGGSGFLESESQISLTIDGSLDGLRAIRKSRAGLYNPALNLRGDLVININWADNAPASTAGHSLA